MDNNDVIIKGRVKGKVEFSHEVYDEKFYEFEVECERLSEIKDVINVTISEKLLNIVKLEEGVNISISGQFRSYNKIVNGKSKLMLTVFVRDISENYEKDENEINLEGFICKEPIYRMTPFKREICDMLVAVNRSYNKSDYLPCIAWGRNAKFISEQPIGTKVKISGRIQSRTYQKRIDETKVENMIAYEVSVGKISLAEESLESKVVTLAAVKNLSNAKMVD